MQPLVALQELAELAASYSAAYERSRASHPSKAAALRLTAIVGVGSPVVPAKAGTQTQACSQREGSGLSANARSRGSSVRCCANDRRMDSPV